MNDKTMGLLVGLAIGAVPAVVGILRGRRALGIVWLCMCGFVGATGDWVDACVVAGMGAVLLMVKKPSNAFLGIFLAVGMTIADGRRYAQETIKRNDEDYRSHPKASILKDYFKAGAFGSAVGFFVYLGAKERQAKRREDTQAAAVRADDTH